MKDFNGLSTDRQNERIQQIINELDALNTYTIYEVMKRRFRDDGIKTAAELLPMSKTDIAKIIAKGYNIVYSYTANNTNYVGLVSDADIDNYNTIVKKFEV